MRVEHVLIRLKEQLHLLHMRQEYVCKQQLERVSRNCFQSGKHHFCSWNSQDAALHSMVLREETMSFALVLKYDDHFGKLMQRLARV